MTKRVLMVHPGPDFSVADVFNGWKRALEGFGLDVRVFATNQRLSFYSAAHLPDYAKPKDENGAWPLKQALSGTEAMTMAMQGLTHDLYTFWPDVVLFVSGFYTSAQLLQVIRLRKHKVVILHTESPYQDDEQLVRAQYADVNLLNDPSNLEDYRQLQRRSYYMPHAYDPAVHYPVPDLARWAPESDFAFIGTLFRSRAEFFGEMLAAGAFRGLAVAFGGSGWNAGYMEGSPLRQFLGHDPEECVENAEVASVYRGTRSGINFYRRESEGEHAGEGAAMGPREVEMAACGLPFIRDPRPESDQLFGDFLPSFSSAGEAAEQLKWLLADEERRRDLGRRARSAVEDRTFGNNARFLLGKLEEL